MPSTTIVAHQTSAISVQTASTTVILLLAQINAVIDWGMVENKYNLKINIENINNNGVNLNPNEIWNIISIMLKNIDNKNTIKDILYIVQKELHKNIKDTELLDIFKRVYQSFELYDLFLLNLN
jgi:hypothetical protein